MMKGNFSLSSLFLCFLKIGCVSFGGFMSLVSMVESQVVERRKWLSAEDMLDGVALASLLPGPMAVNTVAFVGYRLRGGLGALVATVAVLLPTVVFMLVLTELYFRFGTLPAAERVFRGILPAIAAIVLSVCIRMARKNLTSAWQWVGLGLAVLLVSLAPAPFKLYATFGIVALYGFTGWVVFRLRNTVDEASSLVAKEQSTDPDSACAMRQDASSTFESSLCLGGGKILTKRRLLGFSALAVIILLGVFGRFSHPLLELMSTFGGMSLTLFGGGYVFIPMMQEVVVDHFGWLSAQEFVDGIALGQVTPGPILISAAFIGQRVAGISGALLSTLAIFAPPAILMVLLSGMLEQVKSSVAVQSVLGGIRIAVIGLIFKAFLNIFGMSFVSAGGQVGGVVFASSIFALVMMALMRYKVDLIWIIPVAGVAGWIFA